MPATYDSFTGNGSDSTFTVPFSSNYLNKDHVKLYYGRDRLAGTQTSTLTAGTDFNWTSTTQVQLIYSTLNSGGTAGDPYPLPSSKTLTIERQTPNSAQIAAWSDGSNLTSEALNNADLQNLYVIQEQQDTNTLSAAKSIAAETASNTATSNVATLTSTQFNVDGSTALTGNLNFDSNKGINLGTPTAGGDVVNKTYSDLKVLKAGDTMSGNLAMGTNKVTGVGDPTANQDAATKKYTDDTTNLRVAKTGDSMSGNLAMGTNRITGVGDPTGAQDAATKNYVDTGSLLTSGGTMSGNLAMGSNKITGLANPTNTDDATNKSYVDGQVGAQVAAAGDTMSGNLAMGSNKITGLGTPSSNDDATPKTYVDTQVAGREVSSAKLTELATMALATAQALAELTSTEVAKLDDLLATTAELNKVNGFTGNSTDLNKLAGLSATQANLDITSGMSKETSLTTTSDTGFPTSKAVADHVKDVVDSVGGFKIVPDKDTFPTSHPDPSNDAGMVLSITNPTGLTVSSGTSSNGTRDGVSDTVTITGIPSDAGATLTNNYSMLVQTTTTEHTYAFYRFLAKDSDVLSLSDDIDDFANRYRVMNTLPAANDSSNHNGDMVWSKTAEKMYVYNGDYNGSPVGAFEEVQSIGNFFLQSLTFDGSAQDFTIANPPSFAHQIILSINGVIQKPNTGTSTPSEGFALDGSTLKLGSVLPSGTPNFYIICGSTVNIGTPSANTVTTNQLNTSNTGSNGQVLSKSATSETLTWVDVDQATVANEATDTECFPLFNTAATGTLGPKSNANFKFNANTGLLTATKFAGDGSSLTGVSSAEIYGIHKNASGNLIVTTTNGGADNISASDYAAFDDQFFAATGISFSINASGNLIATI